MFDVQHFAIDREKENEKEFFKSRNVVYNFNYGSENEDHNSIAFIDFGNLGDIDSTEREHVENFDPLLWNAQYERWA